MGQKQQEALTNKKVPNGGFGEYVQFSIRRDSLYFQVLMTFVKMYHRHRMLCVPPDDLNILMYTYDEALSMFENEHFCGRFHLEWEITPSFPEAEFMTGFVVHRSEFEKSYAMVENTLHSPLSMIPLQVYANGMCSDPRLFRWYHHFNLTYSVVFVQGDVYVLS